MIARRDFVFAAAAAAILPPLVRAQAQGKVWRIGFLDSGFISKRLEILEDIRGGLRTLGYVEGRNYNFEIRGAEGKSDQIPALAASLVQSGVDLIVADGTACTLAAKNSTTTIPIVMASVGDPIAAGIVKSLSRPGGNVTGTSIVGTQLTIKRFELIHTMVPRAKRFAMLSNPNNPVHPVAVEVAQSTAKQFKVQFQNFDATDLDALKAAIVAAKKSGANALLVQVDTIFSTHYSAIAVLAERERIASAGNGAYAEQGGLVGVGANPAVVYRTTATYIDKIFRGANPGDLPIEQPTKFDLVVNMRTAKALSLKIPQSILLQATKLIE